MAESSIIPTSSHTGGDRSKNGAERGRFRLAVTADVDLRLSSLDGIGPKSVVRFAERDVRDALDLLTLLPNRYRATLRHPDGPTLRAVKPEHVQLRGEITSVRRPRRGTNQPLEVVVTCDDERVVLVWFNLPGSRFAHGFRTGRWIEVEGAVDHSRELIRLVHPRTTWVDGPSDLPCKHRIEGVYPKIEGVSGVRLRRAIDEALNRIGPHLADVVGTAAVKEFGEIREALLTLHAIVDLGAEPEVRLEKARRRLIYEEFHALQSTLAEEREVLRARSRAPRCAARSLSDRITSGLAFTLTQGQRDTLCELMAELDSEVPARRLLQGDVGCGKTIVALLLAAVAADSGAQVAIMAPTDVLARQLHQEAREVLGSAGLRVAFLGGSESGRSRRDTLALCASGDVDVLVGTHALYSDDVAYARLGLVVIDEQHKFGVDQRQKLLSKGVDPHLLCMSATPIPRSLAHALFGDLDLCAIRERPPGRQPVRTYLRGRSSRAAMYEWIAQTVIPKGQQAFIVFPAIDSDARGYGALMEGAEELANGWLRDCRLGVLHGQMNGDAKAEIMRRFLSREVDVLCATTVIEVGVDVPNATVMVVESAEAFGLSQLHQLRGRVGRGGELSRCVLVHGDQAPDGALARLRAFEQSDDGFELAEMDLVLRGPGEFLGARQAGSTEFRFADLLRDSELLSRARDDVRREASKR